MSRNMLRKWSASYFSFIHEHLIKYWSSIVKVIAVTAVLLTSSQSLLTTNI